MRVVASLVLGVVLLFSGRAAAHGVRTPSIDVTEVAPGIAAVRVREVLPGDGVRATFAQPCVTSADGEGDVETTRCPASLVGHRLSVDGLGPVFPEAIVVVTLLSGDRTSHVVTAAAPAFEIAGTPAGLALGEGYVWLGVKHILTGYDHLLFLLGLVFLLRRPRSVMIAESAFTVSHSVSFSAAALGMVHVSPAAAEAAIALSLVLVALDIGRTPIPPRARDGAAVAFLFGFVHGLGFAGGLSEIGVPDHDVAFSLLGFAAGVELGQVAFLALVLLSAAPAAHVTRDVRSRLADGLRRARVPLPRTPLPALLIGGISAYWLIERLLACFAPAA